jgi:hypothetical protein
MADMMKPKEPNQRMGAFVPVESFAHADAAASSSPSPSAVSRYRTPSSAHALPGYASLKRPAFGSELSTAVASTSAAAVSAASPLAPVSSVLSLLDDNDSDSVVDLTHDTIPQQQDAGATCASVHESSSHLQRLLKKQRTDDTGGKDTQDGFQRNIDAFCISPANVDAAAASATTLSHAFGVAPSTSSPGIAPLHRPCAASAPVIWTCGECGQDNEGSLEECPWCQPSAPSSSASAAASVARASPLYGSYSTSRVGKPAVAASAVAAAVTQQRNDFRLAQRLQLELQKQELKERAKRRDFEFQQLCPSIAVILSSMGFGNGTRKWGSTQPVTKENFIFVAQPALIQRFLSQRRDMGNAGSPTKVELAFHGTSPENVYKIRKHGLKVPGQIVNGTAVQHLTDEGVYGKGIYLSPHAWYAYGYAEAGWSSLFVCLVLRGRVYSSPGTPGSGLQRGYDSHQDAHRGNEWIIFHAASVLPIYLLRHPLPASSRQKSVGCARASAAGGVRSVGHDAASAQSASVIPRATL